MNKQYLLQFARSANLVGALVAALSTIQPLLTGHPDWVQVGISFSITFVMVVLHSLIAHINNEDLKNALSKDLDAIKEVLFPVQGRQQGAVYDQDTRGALPTPPQMQRGTEKRGSSGSYYPNYPPHPSQWR
jgi:hypothetical protein